MLCIREVVDISPSISLGLSTSWRLFVMSITTISRTLSWIGLIRKAPSRCAGERNDLLWELQMARCTDHDTFAFLDESAVDGLRVWANDRPPPQRLRPQPSRHILSRCQASFEHFHPSSLSDHTSPLVRQASIPLKGCSCSSRCGCEDMRVIALAWSSSLPSFTMRFLISPEFVMAWM